MPTADQFDVRWLNTCKRRIHSVDVGCAKNTEICSRALFRWLQASLTVSVISIACPGSIVSMPFLGLRHANRACAIVVLISASCERLLSRVFCKLVWCAHLRTSWGCNHSSSWSVSAARLLHADKWAWPVFCTWLAVPLAFFKFRDVSIVIFSLSSSWNVGPNRWRGSMNWRLWIMARFCKALIALPFQRWMNSNLQNGFTPN